MTNEPGQRRWWRIWLTALILVAAIAYVSSYFLPYWNMTLYAPQYPGGLKVEIYLHQIEGDVREIDILNHYIGMEKLEEAAVRERALAPWMIGGIGAALLVFVLIPGRRWAWVLLLPGLLFPVGFVGTTYYWLYTYGNNLDPRAPINIEPFTPTMFGEGVIGQFRTVAGPGAGAYLALAAALLIALSFWLRRRIRRGDDVEEER